MLLTLLSACQAPFELRECAPLADATIDDPEGIVDDELAADLTRLLGEFDAWTGQRRVCVDDVEVVPFIDDEVYQLEDGVAGYWDLDASRIVVSTALIPPLDVLTHELCHALDSWSHLSTDLEAWLPTGGYLPEELYPTDAAVRNEHFAEVCAMGPPARALVDAMQEVCGVSDPLTRALLDDLWVGWGEPPVGVGPEISLSDVEATAEAQEGYEFLPGDQRLFGIGGSAGYMPETADVVTAWNPDDTTGERLHVADSELILPGLDGEPPRLLSVHRNGTISTHQILDTGVEATDEDWLGEIDPWRLDATFGADTAWFQVWGDGQPLQVRDLASGQVQPQPGDEDYAIQPPRARLDGIPYTIAFLEEPSPTLVVGLHTDAVEVIDAPRGLIGIRALPDGGLIGWSMLVLDGVGYEPILIEEGGVWGLSPASCDPGLEFGAIESLGEETYAVGGGIGIQRVVVE